MFRALLPIALALAAAPTAAAPEWRQAREVDVLFSNMDIQPASITLKAGEPARLRFINNGNAAHSFSARDFFAAGEIRARDRSLVSGGRVDLAPGQTREVLIVPKAGRYSARCGNFLHWLLGMRAEIVVE